MDEAMKQIGMDAVDNFLLRFGQLNDCGALMGKVSREMRAGITALKAQRREAPVEQSAQSHVCCREIFAPETGRYRDDRCPECKAQQAPVEKDRCVHGVDVSAACYQGLCYRPNPPVQTQSAPADDVVERMWKAANPEEVGSIHPNSKAAHRMTCALRVAEPIITAKAREGYVPAMVLEVAKEERDRLDDLNATLKQQLATMYTLEQVLPDQSDNYDELYALRSEVVYSWDWSPEMQLTPSGVQQMIRDACCIYHSKLLARLAAPKPTERVTVHKDSDDWWIVEKDAFVYAKFCWQDSAEEYAAGLRAEIIAALMGGM